MIPQKKIHLKDISALAFQHPADTAALTALKQVTGFDEVMKFVLSLTSDRSFRLLYLGSAVRVSETQFPRVNKLFSEVKRVLDYNEEIELFVTYNPAMNAGALGVNRPFITLNSSIVAALDDEELTGVIAHELGHVMSGHILYKTMLFVLLSISLSAIRIPGIRLLIYPVVAALREWDRKSELTADRAGLLATQDPDVSYRTLMKLAGGEQIGEMDMNEFLQQAAEYESTDDVLDSFHKFLNTWKMTHPLPVVRLPKLKRWVDDGSYEKIRSGDYLRRSEETKEKREEHFRRARQEYSRDFEETKDAGSKVAQEVGKSFGKIAEEGGKAFKNAWQQIKNAGQGK